MPSGIENAGTTSGAAAGAAPVGAARAGADVSVPESPAALAVRESGDAESGLEEETRLDRLPMQVDVLVKVRSFRVQDLLAMQKGTVVETVHEHTQDVPARCGGVLLLWSEFEVLDQRLAVRVTRLA
jgi:flagellar motor switch protein FliM